MWLKTSQRYGENIIISTLGSLAVTVEMGYRKWHIPWDVFMLLVSKIYSFSITDPQLQMRPTSLLLLFWVQRAWKRTWVWVNYLPLKPSLWKMPCLSWKQASRREKVLLPTCRLMLTNFKEWLWFQRLAAEESTFGMLHFDIISNCSHNQHFPLLTYVMNFGWSLNALLRKHAFDWELSFIPVRKV